MMQALAVRRVRHARLAGYRGRAAGAQDISGGLSGCLTCAAVASVFNVVL